MGEACGTTVDCITDLLCRDGHCVAAAGAELPAEAPEPASILTEEPPDDPVEACVFMRMEEARAEFSGDAERIDAVRRLKRQACAKAGAAAKPSVSETRRSSPTTRPRRSPPARRCKKGKPCGRSCIAVSKTCRK